MEPLGQSSASFPAILATGIAVPDHDEQTVLAAQAIRGCVIDQPIKSIVSVGMGHRSPVATLSRSLRP